MIRIFLVDDHPVVREGLSSILSDEPEFQVVGEAENGEQALREVAKAEPDVVVVDLRLPGMTGSDVCEHLRGSHPQVRSLILTSFPSQAAMVSAFSAGARGFAVKESDPRLIREAVRTVARGETFVDPRIAAKLVALATKNVRAKGPHGLTRQEMRVLEFLPRGLTNRQIGGEMGVSEQTVKTHLRNAMAKLGARDRSEAASIVTREGLA
ncbi:MAG: response regulator [Actinomycetota bacterium]